MLQLEPAPKEVGQLLVGEKSPLIVTPVMPIAAIPMSVKVTVCAVLLAPTACPANVTLPGETCAAGIPVPARLTVCGVPLALSAKFSEALRFPVADGVNVTLTVQALLGVTVAPVQVSALLAKSLGFVPPIVTVEKVRLAVPVLVTVSAWAALVVVMG
jgi:hypothetical protein